MGFGTRRWRDIYIRHPANFPKLLLKLADEASRKLPTWVREQVLVVYQIRRWSPT